VKGGEIVAVGTPEQVVQEERSFTGAYLRPLLERGKNTDDCDKGAVGASSLLVPSDVEAPKRGRRKKVAEAAE
jgi:hypothetical protein